LNVRAAARQEKGGTVLLHGGTYRLDKTFVLTPADAGTTYCAFPGETPVLTGGQPISGWKQDTGKVWVAEVPKGWRFHYLFVNGQRAQRSRWINHEQWRNWPKDHRPAARQPEGQLVSFTQNKAALEGLPSNGDVEMVCILAQFGKMANGVLTAIDSVKGTARWNSELLALRHSRNPGERGYNFENARKFLDQPGEWAVDSAAGKVWYWPRAGEDMTRAEVLAPRVYELLRLQGDEKNQRWVRKVTLSGLTLQCTDRMPENEWPEEWLKRQWENVDAMLYVQGAEDRHPRAW
jgi:hypothetical protein